MGQEVPTGLNSSHTEGAVLQLVQDRRVPEGQEEVTKADGSGKGVPKNCGDENQWPVNKSARSGLRGCRVAGKGSYFCRDRSCPRVVTFGCSPWHLRRHGQDRRGPRLVWRRKGAGEPLLACPAGAW